VVLPNKDGVIGRAEVLETSSVVLVKHLDSEAVR
jgi:hypothetical protein